MNYSVSICVPVYGVENYIEKCCHSLFKQSYEDTEYIFVDDCSPDKSISVLQEVLKDYPHRQQQVKIIHHTMNKGLSAARNTAMDAATGDYVMHVDSDDYLEIDAVKLSVEKAIESQADMVVFDMNIVYSDKTVYSSARVSSNRLQYLHDIIRRDCSVCVCGALYKRSLYQENHIRAIEGLNYGEDYVTKPRLVYHSNKVVALPMPLYNYVKYNASSYTQLVTKKSIQDVLFAIDILLSFFKEKSQSDKEIDYKEIEKELKIRNKVFLLEYCSKSNRSYVLKLFPEMNGQNTKMALKHHIVWQLSCRHWHLLLNVYLGLGNFIKRTFHR